MISLGLQKTALKWCSFAENNCNYRRLFYGLGKADDFPASVWYYPGVSTGALCPTIRNPASHRGGLFVGPQNVQKE
jgi:hypothetical protein